VQTLTRPHVSAALQHLRRSILGVGGVLAVCLVAQVIIWGVVHFTDVRRTELRPEGAVRHEPIVVQKPSDLAASATAVTATTWTLVIGMMCLPLASLLPGVPFAGVFRAYDALVQSAENFKHKGPGAPSSVLYYGLNLMLPLLLLAGLGASLLRFHLGVEQGAMLSSLSEVDEKLEREIRTMKLGALASSRAGTAMNTAFTATPAAAPVIDDEPIPMPRSMKEPPVGRPLKRPV